MQILSLVSRKGGTGKSTLAIALAGAALEAGHKVCLIEADPLGTLSNWRARRDCAEPAVETVYDGYALTQRVRKLASEDFTLVIIDTAGGWSETFNAAVGVADLCLIPARPSLADIEATGPALSTVRSAGKPFAFILNQAPARSFRVGNAADALSETAAAAGIGEVIASPAIVARNDQQDALAKGVTVLEFAAEGKSAGEIRSLWQWVSARLETLANANLPVEEAATARIEYDVVQQDSASDIFYESEGKFDSTAVNEQTTIGIAV
jgi:chromosome partitioning protein